MELSDCDCGVPLRVGAADRPRAKDFHVQGRDRQDSSLPIVRFRIVRGNVKELDERRHRPARDPAAAHGRAKSEQMKLDEDKKQVEELAAAERKRERQGPACALPNEDDIAVARKRNLDLMQDQIKRENTAIVNLEKKKSDVEKQIPLGQGQERSGARI